MVTSEEVELWKKLLGNRVNSFTDDSKQYTIFHGEDGWVCDCMDFKIRKGSHKISYEDPLHNESGVIMTCKHIAQFLADNGAEVWELFAWGRKAKIKKQSH